MANVLNTFFAEIGSNLAAKIPPRNENPAPIEHQAPVFEFTELALIDMVNIIWDFKSSNSAGITSRILKAAGPSIYPVILHLVNSSISQRTFPDCWKMGCVIPLFKEGDRSNPSNYRPISVLPCVGKIMQQVIHTQLYEYCTSHHILSPSHSGFRKGHSTASCLTDFLANIFDQVDNGRVCGVLFLDL